MKNIAVAIDGPASSGKSTVSKRLADDFNFIYIDTGAMYRAVTLLSLEQGLDPADEEGILEALKNHELSFQRSASGQRTLIDGEDVSERIRHHDVTQQVSEVSAHSKIRKEMVARQRDLAEGSNVVMDGRDIGTVVLPHADLKFFMEASVDERTRRRFEENKERGIATDYASLKAEIQARDEYDSQRSDSPLKAADDAIIIDTTDLDIDQVVALISQYLEDLLEKIE